MDIFILVFHHNVHFHGSNRKIIEKLLKNTGDAKLIYKQEQFHSKLRRIKKDKLINFICSIMLIAI